MTNKVVLFYPTPGIEMYFWFPFPYLYLVPFLERQGFVPIIVDARADRNWQETLRHHAQDALCVGITAMSGPDLLNAMAAATLIRQHAPQTPIAWGGHHVVQFPEHPLREGLGDYVFLGHAEHTFPKILHHIANKTKPFGVKGVIYHADGAIVGDRSAQIVNFDYDIFPAFEALDIEKYRSPNNITSYFSSRGCPFKCTFCTTGDYSYSYRTLPQVEAELAYLVEDKGFQNVFFQDGTFFISRQRVMDIARVMKNFGGVKWKAKAKATSMLNYSPDELRLLYESGLRSVFFGIESGSQRVLDRMAKKITPDDTLASARLCAEYGFEFYGSFMFATPGEDTSDLGDTIDLMRAIKKISPNATLQNCIYLPLPGTPMYDDAVSHGFAPPETMSEWGNRDISSRFEKRADIVWLEPQVLRDYAKMYNDEFPNYRFVYEKEKDGDYTSPLHVGVHERA